MKANLFALFLFCTITSTAQELITEVLPFQDDPAKSYSAYIPSSYNPDSSNTTIIAFHPFNTSRWDGESWRDTLVFFAESVGAILISPDGGADGKVDDPIDTAFTSFILDKMKTEYNIDEDQTYLCGFSWGGRAAYKYGLHRPGIFKGSLITGAAVNGTNEVSNVITNAEGENYYLIHGSNDNFNTRFTIISNALIDNNACLESNVLQGIGHTIDYPDRNQILKDGFDWLVNSVCETSSTLDNSDEINLYVFPNPSTGSIQFSSEIIGLELYLVHDIDGNIIPFDKRGLRVRIFNKNSGMHILSFKDKVNKITTKKIILH